MSDSAIPAAHRDEVLVDEQHPWPGLVPFREHNQRFFFGRSLEQEELLRSIRRGITTLLFGQSGLGKTSLLQAGLFPRLRENGYLPVLVRIDYSHESSAPSEQIKRLLNAAIAEAGLDAARRIELEETLWEYFHRRELALIDRTGEPIIPVIVFDQFEELFTLGLPQRKAECQSFITELSDLTENRPPAAVKARLERAPDQVARYMFNRDHYRIVITMREDFLPALEIFRATAPSLGRNRFRLTRMKGPQALEAVIEPGRGIVTEAVAQRIVSMVGGGPGGDVSAAAIKDVEVESSLLSLFCSELNERRLAAGQSEISADLVERSRRDILRSFYERALNDQPRAVREFIEDQLITDSGARDSIARERAERLLADKGVPPGAIDELVRRRLLHIEERREGPRVELIHDVLLDVVRQGKAERSSIELRHSLARTRRRYLMRAAAAIAVVIAIAGSITYVAHENARREAEQSQKLEQQNQQLAAQSAKLEEQNQRLDEQNQRLTAYRDRLRESLESLMPVLSKFVERSDAQSLGGDKVLDEQVRPLMDKIITLADEMRGPGYDSRFMSVKALSLVILAKVTTRAAPETSRSGADESGGRGEAGAIQGGSRYIDEATQIATELLRRARSYDDVSKGFDVFDAITQVWEARRNTELALRSVGRSIGLLQEIAPGVINVDQTHWFVGSAHLRQAGIMRKASRFDEAEASLRAGITRLANTQATALLSLLVDLYNNLGDVVLSARERTTEQPAKRKAMQAALVEFEHAWDTAVDYYKLQDTIPTRNWMARHARKVGGLYEDLRNVDRARRFYDYQLRVRRSLLPDGTKPLSVSYDVESAKRDVAVALRDLGSLERSDGDKQKAVDYYIECASLIEPLSKTPPNLQSLGSCYAGLGESLRDKQKRADSIAAYEKAREIRERLATAEPGNTDLQDALAFVYSELADGLLAEKKPEQALAYAQRGFAVRQRLAAADPNNPVWQRTLGLAYRVMADCLLANGKRAEALAYYQNVIGIRELIVAADPDNTDRRSDLAYVYERVATALLQDGKREDALVLLRKSMDLRERNAADEPGRLIRQSDLAFIYVEYANALLDAGKRADALAYYRKGLVLREKLFALEPNDIDRQSDVAYVYAQLGDALSKDEKYAEAVVYYEKGRVLREKLVAREPNNLVRQSSLAYVYVQLADALVELEKPAEAVAYYRKGLELREKLAALEPNDITRQGSLAYVCIQLADALMKQAKTAEAVGYYHKGRELREKLAALEPNDITRQSNLAYAYVQLADALMQDAKRGEALVYYQKARELREKLATLEPNSITRQSSLAYVYIQLADALMKEGNRAEALAYYQKGRELREKLVTLEPKSVSRKTNLIYVYRRLALVSLADGKRAEALGYYRKTLALREAIAAQAEQDEIASDKRAGPTTASRLSSVSWSAVFAEDFNRALTAAERALELSPGTLWIIMNRAHALMFLGRAEEARAVYLRYRDQQNVQGTKSWRTVLLEDFAELREAGLTRPLMTEIEEKLAPGG
ncbi:MAG: tetratricopeptide repeat protein [Xanthobacteraceae bacterium]